MIAFHGFSGQQKTTQKCVVLRKPWLLCILITVNVFRNATIFPDLQTRCTTQASVNSRRTPPRVINCAFDQTIVAQQLFVFCLFIPFPQKYKYLLGSPNIGGVLPSTVFRDSKRRRKNASSFAGAENRTRTGTDVTPRDFKSLASAYSATSASLEASPGIEPGMKALQASALPLGYDAIRKRAFDKTFVILTLERETGFGPATSTLARWHSTTESLPQVGRFAPSFSATTIIYQIN